MKRINPVFLLTTITLLFSACGGGGGGDGDTTTSTIAYTGLTTPAVITTANAEHLAEEGLGAGTDDLVASDLLLGVETTTDELTSLPHNLVIAQILTDKAKALPFDGSSSLPGVIQSDTSTEACSGGGTLTISLTVDDVTGEFSGAMVFTDCTESDVTISGTVDVSGVIDLNTLDSVTMTMTFSSMTEVYEPVGGESESYTMSGSIYFDIDRISSLPSTATVVMNYTIRDNISGNVYKLENYRAVATDDGAKIEMTVSGKFYDPDYGYGVITTLETLLFNYTDDWPYSGKFQIDGDNSSLRVTCISNAQYTLEVDEDGDGIYETVTTETW